ncbi:hypothetical protein OIU79_020344 [Salix purpurea]|uniref:Uncharacterized protein n=1 Tax=Salix purpurea TaxID=77065 RepID=A0A9Q0SGB8_SALPP|nr:hypothetical protein OIU79_020344 [Salix purpurea]
MGAFSFNSSSSLENENSTFTSRKVTSQRDIGEPWKDTILVAFKDGVLLMRSRSIPFIVRQVGLNPRPIVTRFPVRRDPSAQLPTPPGIALSEPSREWPLVDTHHFSPGRPSPLERIHTLPPDFAKIRRDLLLIAHENIRPILLVKSSAYLSRSPSIQKIVGGLPGRRDEERNDALARILPKSFHKYCGRKGDLSIGWTHLPPPPSKVKLSSKARPADSRRVLGWEWIDLLI